MNFSHIISYVAIILLIFSGSVDSNPKMESVYKQESIKQGSVQLKRAREFYNDRLYDQCIQVLNSFTIIYPFHPDKIEAWNLLSSAYLKLGRFKTSAEIDLNTYLENPTHEEANKAYLRAGRSYALLGDYDMAKRIFHDLRESSFFPEIAQEADLELRQWSVMSGNTRQIQEFP